MKIPQRAGVIRLLLEYTKTPYEEKLYKDFAESIEKWKEKSITGAGGDWYEEKYKLDMPFPNIPYLFIDGKKISQTKAIVKYLCKKNGLGESGLCWLYG